MIKLKRGQKWDKMYGVNLRLVNSTSNLPIGRRGKAKNAQKLHVLPSSSMAYRVSTVVNCGWQRNSQARTTRYEEGNGIERGKKRWRSWANVSSRRGLSACKDNLPWIIARLVDFSSAWMLHQQAGGTSKLFIARYIHNLLSDSYIFKYSLSLSVTSPFPF